MRLLQTKRIDVNENIDDSQLDEESDRNLFEQRIYRKYLYNNPQYDETTFEQRIKGEQDFMRGINERVSKFPKCPTCGSTNIQPIGTGERAISVIGLGLFSGKICKNHECLNCKARW